MWGKLLLDGYKINISVEQKEKNYVLLETILMGKKKTPTKQENVTFQCMLNIHTENINDEAYFDG